MEYLLIKLKGVLKIKILYNISLQNEIGDENFLIKYQVFLQSSYTSIIQSYFCPITFGGYYIFSSPPSLVIKSFMVYNASDITSIPLFLSKRVV